MEDLLNAIGTLGNLYLDSARCFPKVESISPSPSHHNFGPNRLIPSLLFLEEVIG